MWLFARFRRGMPEAGKNRQMFYVSQERMSDGMQEERKALEQALENGKPGDWGLFAPLTVYFDGFATHESCGKCVPCREGSKRILELLERVQAGERSEEILKLIESLADTVIATALCGHGRVACRMVLRVLLRFRGLDRQAGFTHPGLVEDAEREHPFIHADECRGCGKCRRGCPMGAISGSPGKTHVIDTALCVNCGACVSNCPFGAVRPANEKKPDAEGVMYVDGLRAPFGGETNVLAVIRRAGIDMPTFCYHSELSVYGACRMCVVECEDGRIEAACSLAPRDGLRVRTNTARLLRSRRMILELMLASHRRDCTTCEVSGSCTLQRLAVRFGIRGVRFENDRARYERDESSGAITLDLDRCILCGDCAGMCEEVQGMGILRFSGRGSGLRLVTDGAPKLAQTDCVGCGQCSAVCPTGAIFVRNQIGEAWAALHDPKKRVVVQIAPAVRVAMGEVFGMEPGENVMDKLVSLWRIMGAEAVYDTSFGADLTIMEESRELTERLQSGERLPMFTSCCPAWVRYVENRRPALLPQLSSCRSPMQMLASIVKEHYAPLDQSEGRETFHIALMPCTAKKTEAARPELGGAVDLVLTTQEFSLMIKESGIRFAEVTGEAADMPFGLGTGAGVIFGSSGGVAEAVARQLAGNDAAAVAQLPYSGLRGTAELRHAVVPMDGRELRVAVVHGLANAQRLLDDIESGREQLDFVEVMACRTGCVGGAGQPRPQPGGRRKRSAGLYSADRETLIKLAGQNPIVQRLYTAGLIDRAEELLHTTHEPPEKAEICANGLKS